jgi:chromosomal replication initiation ATPase DnaA
LPPPSKIQLNSNNNEEIEKFYKIIKALQDEETTVIVFTTPLNRIYLDELSKSTKISFDNILKNISEKYNVKIYEFEDKYADLEIWNNVDHVAYNNKSIIFSDQIAEMILKETKP